MLTDEVIAAHLERARRQVCLPRDPDCHALFYTPAQTDSTLTPDGAARLAMEMRVARLTWRLAPPTAAMRPPLGRTAGERGGRSDKIVDGERFDRLTRRLGGPPRRASGSGH